MKRQVTTAVFVFVTLLALMVYGLATEAQDGDPPSLCNPGNHTVTPTPNWSVYQNRLDAGWYLPTDGVCIPPVTEDDPEITPEVRKTPTPDDFIPAAAAQDRECFIMIVSPVLAGQPYRAVVGGVTVVEGVVSPYGDVSLVLGEGSYPADTVLAYVNNSGDAFYGSFLAHLYVNETWYQTVIAQAAEDGIPQCYFVRGIDGLIPRSPDTWETQPSASPAQ
jgi:hypothetical protein